MTVDIFYDVFLSADCTSVINGSGYVSCMASNVIHEMLAI